MNKSELLRIKIIFIFFVLFFTAVIAKAVKVQIIDGPKLIAKSSSQFFRENKVFPRRGFIYDRHGNPMALNIQTYSIFTIPRNLDENFTALRELAAVVPDLSFGHLKQRVASRDRFTWLARKISLTQEQVLSIEGIEGVHIEAVPKRLYPNNELLSQILGFVGVDNVGLAGLEHRFDEDLRGRPIIQRYIIDNRGRPVKFESIVVENEAKNLHLSIDKDIQFVAERYLREAVIKHEADLGGIGIMNARTGEIIAMANYPSFNSNHPHQKAGSIHRLPFVTDPIEPGSTFKTFTIASALENKIARPDTNYYCERGRLQIGRHVVREAELNRSFEWLSVSDILRFSSNIGTSKIAFDLTYPRLKKTIDDFGFGQRTGIEVPGESRGILADDSNVAPIHLSNISFGQGIATTGIQMLQAYAVIANGGYLVSPTLLKRDENYIPRKKRIISEEVASSIEEMLIQAVENGTGGNARVTHFTIAGKTSTAQRVSPVGGYEGHIPGFIGYPTNIEEKFVVYVYIDNPKGETYYGNRVAAPVFQKVMQHILYNSNNLARIEKNNQAPNDSSRSMDRVNLVQSSPRIIGSGRVPNFIGLDRRSSAALAHSVGLELEHNGIGVVNHQSLSPGSAIKGDSVLKLRYSPPIYE